MASCSSSTSDISHALANLAGEDRERNGFISPALVCVGCRCGWLCCECSVCCMTCKELRKYCLCQWDQSPTKVRCLFCLWLLDSCKCCDRFRCKWCQVSLMQCKRGGCIQHLPERFSVEAEPYVTIFNTEEIEEGPEEQDPQLTDDSASVSDSMSSLNTGSPISSDAQSLSTSFSMTSMEQEEWWRSQRASDTDCSSIITTSYDSLSDF